MTLREPSGRTGTHGTILLMLPISGRMHCFSASAGVLMLGRGSTCCVCRSWGSRHSSTTGPEASRSGRRARSPWSRSWPCTPDPRSPGSGSPACSGPDSTDAQALTNLRRELHHLRQVLGDEPSLVVTPRDLCWRDTETCRLTCASSTVERQAALAAAAAGDDDGLLLHAAAAIAVYRGELLPGVYEDWLLEARSQLERQCVELCDLVCAARARTRRPGRGGASGPAPGPAAAAGGGRLPHADGTAGRPG